jgi:hypothetical protein
MLTHMQGIWLTILTIGFPCPRAIAPAGPRTATGIHT